MGRQINFYMSEKVQEDFFDFLEQNKFAYMDFYVKTVEELALKNVFNVYLHKESYGQIVKSEDNRYINSLASPVIQFRKSCIEVEKKEIHRGRLWMMDWYYNETGEKIKKEEMLIKDYHKLVRWIKKNVPYQEFYNGKFVEKDYINNEIIQLQKEGFILC